MTTSGATDESARHGPYLRAVGAAFGADIDYATLMKVYGADPLAEKHAAAIALYFMYYNFGRVHQTLRVTPAMEAGVANHVCRVEEIVALLG